MEGGFSPEAQAQLDNRMPAKAQPVAEREDAYRKWANFYASKWTALTQTTSDLRVGTIWVLLLRARSGKRR